MLIVLDRRNLDVKAFGQVITNFLPQIISILLLTMVAKMQLYQQVGNETFQLHVH